MDFNAEAEIGRTKSVVMERLFFHFHKIIPDLALSRGQIEFYTRLDQAMVGTIAILQGWLLDGHKRDVRTEIDTVESPASPWQFFKQRYAPRWLLRRYPVVMETKHFRVAIHHHYICPHVLVPNERSDLHFLWMGEMSEQIPKGSVERYESQ